MRPLWRQFRCPPLVLITTLVGLNVGCGGGAYDEQFQKQLALRTTGAVFLELEDPPKQIPGTTFTIGLPKSPKGGFQEIGDQAEDQQRAVAPFKGLFLDACKAYTPYEAWYEYHNEGSGELPVNCFIGSIDAKGKTLAQVEASIVDRLKRDKALTVAAGEIVAAKKPPKVGAQNSSPETIEWRRIIARGENTMERRPGGQLPEQHKQKCKYQIWLTGGGENAEVVLVAWRIPDAVNTDNKAEKTRFPGDTMPETAAGTLSSG